MSRVKIIISMVVGVLLFVGCATPTKVDSVHLTSSDYGTYPTKYKNISKAYFRNVLKDPISAQYRFSKPYKAYIRDIPVAGGKPAAFGYIIEVWVNAKNSYGGYTGEKLYRLFIRNNVVISNVLPNVWFSERWYQ